MEFTFFSAFLANSSFILPYMQLNIIFYHLSKIFSPFSFLIFFFCYNYNHLFPCYSLFGKGSQFKDLKQIWTSFNLWSWTFQPCIIKINCFHFWNTSILCIYKSLKCAPLNNNLMWIYKFSHKNIRCAKKWNCGCAFKSVLNSQKDFHSWTISTSQINEK